MPNNSGCVYYHTGQGLVVDTYFIIIIIHHAVHNAFEILGKGICTFNSVSFPRRKIIRAAINVDKFIRRINL